MQFPFLLPVLPTVMGADLPIHSTLRALSQLLQLPTAHLIQGEGERMGSPVLQGQHPHFQPNQVRKRARSLTPRGSAFSAWGVGETVGAAPPLPTQSPGQTGRHMSAHRFSGLQKPSSLGTGDREEDPGPKEVSNLTPRGGDVGKKTRKAAPISPRQSSLPPTSLLPTNSLRASGNAFDGASCPFCRVFGLWCGGAGIQSGRGRGKGEEGARASRRKHPAPKIWLCLLSSKGKESPRGRRPLGSLLRPTGCS